MTFPLSRVLRSQIPLSKQMGIRVVDASPKRVKFHLPLKPNRNHKMTAFGGTLIAAQALASWALLMEVITEKQVDAEVVLQREQSEFHKPVTTDFTVETRPLARAQVSRFFQTLKHHNKARIEVSAQAVCNGVVTCEFTGYYVAILKKRAAGKGRNT